MQSSKEWRDKKAFLSDQCKEREEKNRMGKTRDLFKKIRDTKETFHAKMGSIKDRNGMELKQRILRRGGKNTQKNRRTTVLFFLHLKHWLYSNTTHLYIKNKQIRSKWFTKKIFTTQIIMMVWSLSITTNKASGGDGIPVELFQNLKDDAVKVLHWICQQIWKTQQWPQDWKRSLFIPIPKKGNAKECSNYSTISLSHTLAK